jgi:phosphoribosyl-AMP cyclohydrolase
LQLSPETDKLYGDKLVIMTTNDSSISAVIDIGALVAQVKFDANGLVAAVVQDATDSSVLMMAWMNKEALELTATTGQAHFYSRSRKALWLKGQTSGHIQKVRSISIDCDGDTILLKVDQTEAACHEGYVSCFFREWDAAAGKWKIVGTRVFDPAQVYKKR